MHLHSSGPKNEHSGDSVYIEGVLNRIIETNFRKNVAPSAVDKGGDVKGVWSNNKYSFLDSFIPQKFNEKALTIREIKDRLYRKYGITFESISYINGNPDFSVISIATIGIDKMLERYVKKNGLQNNVNTFSELKNMNLDTQVEIMEKVFTKSRRNTNFDLADEILSESHVFIPGLGSDYSKDAIYEWRKKERFTWHESIHGYYLVPSIIHGNLPHTGLVGWERIFKEIRHN